MARAKVLKDSTCIAVKADGSLRLAVVADTHSAPHSALAGHLSALRPDAILHAGDIGDLEVLEALSSIAPVFAVRGNVDACAPNLPDQLTLDVVAGAELKLRVLLTHIGVNGPRLQAEVAREARAEGASLVVCGHSHVPFIGLGRGLTVFNPGSCGPRRFHLPVVFGTLELTRAGVRLAHVDCVTGKAWAPP
jgi:putative phosphoesterase